MARPGYDSPVPIFESRTMRVDQTTDGALFVELTNLDPGRSYVPRADMVAMARAVLERLEGK